MNTPKTDAFVMSKYASRDDLYKEMRESHRQLETQVQELREALEGLVSCINSDAMTDYPPSVWGAYPPEVMESARAVLERTK